MEQNDIYEPDLTVVPADLLRSWAEEYGTPLLVYDADTLRLRHRAVEEAFGWNPGFMQFFPVWAADEPALLRLLGEQGSGAACSNGLELSLARMAGIPAEKILFHAPYPRWEDMRRAAEMGCVITINRVGQLTRLLREGILPKRLGLRFQPSQRFHLRGHMSVLSEPSRFGMAREELLHAAALLKDAGQTELGLYMSLSSNARPSGYLAAMAEALLELVPEVGKRSGNEVCWCDLGGGIPIPDRKRPDVDLDLEAELVRQAFQKSGRADMQVRTQLGRFVAGPAGVFLTTVLDVQSGSRNFLGVDASIADLPRISMSGATYHISLLGSCGLRDRQTYYVEGCSMEKADHLGKHCVLPRTEEGDILVFHNTGAFTRSMASNYGSSLRCSVLLADNGKARLIRRREQTDVFLRLLSDEQKQDQA